MDMGEVGSGSGVPEEEGEGARVLGMQRSSSFGEIRVEANGSIIEAVRETERYTAQGKPVVSVEDNVNGELIGEEKAEKELPMKSVEVPVNCEGGSEGKSASPATKGKGLRRWRRIKRDTSRVGPSHLDFDRVLKRHPPVLEEPTKSRDENKHKSDGEGESSVASVDIGNLASGPLDVGNSESTPSDAGNLDSGSNYIGHSASDSHLGSHAAAINPELAELLVSGAGFSVGADSDNSEERSSKSSTAASAPRHKHDWFGFGRERIRAKNVSGKVSGHGNHHRGSRGKGGQDTSKKIREDRAGFRKENSRSSVESDLRSTNAIFLQQGSTSSNARHAQEFENYDGEHSDNIRANGAVQAGYHKENGQADEELSREDSYNDDGGSKEGGAEESFCFNGNQDPLDESIVPLQAALEALEKELEIFEEIGVNTNSVTDNSSDQSSFEEIEVNSSPALESRLTYLTKKVEYVERELQEASKEVKSKELRILEMEGILGKTHLPTSKMEDKILSGKECIEMEIEFEGLFKRYLEMEIECLVLKNSTEAWNLFVEQHSTRFKEHESLLEKYDRLVVELVNAEDKAITLKKGADELEASCKELLGAQGLLMLQNRACRSSLCFFLQLVVLCLTLWVLIFRLSFPSDEVVPT